VVNNQKSLRDGVIKKFLSRLSPLHANIKEIYLFGSRSRGDWRPDSDYDILIVLSKKDREIISKFYDAVAEILLDSGKMISLKIFTSSEFNRLSSIPTPFMERVLTEGLKLGTRK
jgi:predicted nucleotidyltransferase